MIEERKFLRVMVNTSNMYPFTTDDAMPIRHSKPVIKRSVSLGFDNSSSCPEKRRERTTTKTNLRYKPYSVLTRRSLVLRSNSQQYSQVGNTRVSESDSKRTKRAFSSRKKNSTRRKQSDKFNTDLFSVNAGETLYDKLIKENKLQEEKKLSMLEMASRLKDSLTIDGNDSGDSSPTSTCGNHKQTDGEHTFVNFSNVCNDSCEENAFRCLNSDNCKIKCHREFQYTNRRNEREVTQDNDNEFGDLFLPSFDDAFFASTLFLKDTHNAKEKEDILSNEKGPKMDHCNREDTFLDNESVTQELRKADTVLLFDDKENECDDDFDFSVPIFPSQSSCEGHKAQLSWSELFHGCSKESHNSDESESDTDSIGRENDVLFNLDEILSTEWLDRTPFLMMSQKFTNYNDLSQMQGTYCCTVCSTNLEVDPFKTRQRYDMFSLSTFNGSSTPRSHDCDVTLYCPSCCSDRLVYHADRL